MHKVDLHIHTSRSTCYRDKSVAVEQILHSALSAGMDAIAITDHHSFAGAVELRDVAKGSSMIVFPGIELTTREGHFLGIFDVDTPDGVLADFLRWLGILPADLGDGHLVAEADIESILEEIDRRGGVGLAAHIERWPSGFLESKEPRRAKEAIHASEHLSALEITVPADKTLWNGGLVRGYSKKYACVQASDAHSLSEIGRRFVLMEMEKIDLSGLRLAFQEHEQRIVFPDVPGR